MDAQSKSFSGLVSNLEDSWTQFLRTAGQPLVELGKKILIWLLDLVNNVLPKVMEMMKDWKNVLAENKTMLIGIGAAIVTALVPALYAA